MKNRIAVIGGGYWGKNLIRNFAQLDHLEIIGDTDPQILNKYSLDYPNIKCTSDIDSIFSNDSIDGIVISTPAETHGDLAKRALLAEKDVFVEKPLCLDIDQGRELVGITKENNKILMVGHLLWYHPAVCKLSELVKEGKLGQLQYIYSNRLNFGKFRWQENVLWSFAPHDISVILGLTGEMPQEVDTTGESYLQKEIADITMTNLKFSNGVRAHIFVSWLNAFKEQKFVVVGSKMMAVFDDLNPWNKKLILYPHKVDWKDQIPTANKAEGEAVYLKEEEPLKMECQHFLDCIKTRSSPRTSGEEGLRVLKVLKASQSSLETRKSPE